MSTRVSLGDMMSAAGNRPIGFDYLRLALACGVVLCHSFTVNEDMAAVFAAKTGPMSVGFGGVVPMFFALSGFLVAGSLERSRSLIGFMGLRALRIVPALAMEVLLSALILGPIFTTLDLASYFSAPTFRAYFLNIAGDIQYVLPGVFADHPWPLLNVQLWTVPIELKCYVVLAALAALGIAARRVLLTVLVVTLQLAVVGYVFLFQAPILTPFPGKILISCFLVGLALYQFRHRVPWSGSLFIVSVLTMLGLLCFPRTGGLLALPAAYAAAYLGVMNPPRSRILLSGDYSYGLYLYGFPIQQALYALLPWSHSWWTMFILSLPSAMLFAVASWWLVEKPVLGLRRYFVRAERPPSVLAAANDASELGGATSTRRAA